MRVITTVPGAPEMPSFEILGCFHRQTPPFPNQERRQSGLCLSPKEGGGRRTRLSRGPLNLRERDAFVQREAQAEEIL